MLGTMSKSWVFSFLLVACGGSSGGGGGGDDGMEPGPDATEQISACTSSSDCGGDKPYCHASGACVECETSAQCPTDRPVCSSSAACEAACTGTETTASFIKLPTDIIWVVDQSGSMNQETQYVQTKINDFAALINASNIDYHVVMIATPTGTNPICVPGPLGGASCGNNTRFRLVDQRIGSHDGPSLAISKYSSYSSFLRPNATKHFVFITDDNSTMSAASFTSGVNALMPSGMFTGFKVHAIYAYGNGLSTGCTGPFGTGAAVGTNYTTLVTNTGGARGVICQNDWNQVFTDITTAVVSGTQVSCELAVPAPPAGETLDPSKVNVKYVSGATASTLGQVPTAADCGAAGGWYYDDNVNPTKITICPSTCSSVQSDPAANLKIELGCSTQIL
jgi:hypothetical protein